MNFQVKQRLHRCQQPPKNHSNGKLICLPGLTNSQDLKTGANWNRLSETVPVLPNSFLWSTTSRFKNKYLNWQKHKIYHQGKIPSQKYRKKVLGSLTYLVSTSCYLKEKLKNTKCFYNIKIHPKKFCFRTISNKKI